MKFSLNQGKAILFSLLALCASCGDADLFDTDKWSSKVDGWEPGIKAAVAHGEFSLWDLLRDSSMDANIVKELVGDDSVLVIKYTEKDIYQTSIDEVFQLEGSTIAFAKTLSLPALTEEVEVVAEKPVIEDVVEAAIPLPAAFSETSLSSITLNDGLCTFRLLPVGGLNYEMTVSYLSEGIKKELFSKSSGTESYRVSLEGRTFDLTDNKIELFLQVTLQEGTYTGGDLDVSLSFSGYDFEKVEGKIVKTGGIDMAGDFDLDVDFLNDISGNFKFADPQLELVVRNKGIGLPVAVDMTFKGKSKENVPGELTLKNPLVFRGNPSNTQIDTIPAVINKDNSTIVEFLSLPPQGRIDYFGNVALNPEGENNVVYRNASMDMDVNISIPLAITGTLSYCDTLTDIDIDETFADKIVEGVISLNVQENALPLDLSVPRMILLDKNNVPLDTIRIANGEGELAKIEAGKGGILNFYIAKETAKKLGQTKNILLEAAISGESGEPVKADARLKFVLALEARAVIDDYEDF